MCSMAHMGRAIGMVPSPGSQMYLVRIAVCTSHRNCSTGLITALIESDRANDSNLAAICPLFWCPVGVPKSVPKRPFRGVIEHSSVLLDYPGNQRSIMTLKYQPFLAESHPLRHDQLAGALSRACSATRHGQSAAISSVLRIVIGLRQRQATKSIR